MGSLSQVDPEVNRCLQAEINRQWATVNLIASENYTSAAVIEAQGSFLTNKYAEGYPRRRYYGGCENMDTIEDLAIKRACELFKADYANVQPHSGAQANMAAYFVLLEPGDTVLGMSLAHGGHLTHGSPVNFSGRLYNFVPYGVNRETERIDYAELEKLAKEHRPKLIVVGASAYSRIIDFETIRRIADEVGAAVLVDMAHIAGIIAAGLHPTPVPYADVITSTTHKTLRGPRGGFILARGGLGAKLDSAVFPGMQGGPLMHVIAGKAVVFGEAMQPDFADYQRAMLDNATALADGLQELGLRLVAGGTDNHMVLVDLTATGITGREAEEALGAVGIVVNRNAIPFDPRSPRITSGIRLGAPAVSSRGFGTAEMKQVAALIVKVLNNINDSSVQAQVAAEVGELARRFPLPGASAA